MFPVAHMSQMTQVVEITVFEIARWTEARDWQKQRRSGKATVYAGPKVCQSNLVFGNSHFSFKVPNCLIIWIFIVPMCSIYQELGFCCISCSITWWNPDLETTDNFLDIAYFFGPPKVNVGPPKVSSLMDRLSINSQSTISKTEIIPHGWHPDGPVLFSLHSGCSLLPSDATWWRGSGSTLVQVMACCLTVTSHYLILCCMTTSPNGNIFHTTGHLCGEFTDHWWIPHTKANDVELWFFLWSVPE